MDIIEIYNPANARNLTPEQEEAMKDLTNEEIEVLAKAYPNQPTGNAYLVYYVTTDAENKQRYPLGTWASLHNLRKLGQKHILPIGFRKNLRYTATKGSVAKVAPLTTRVVDLSKEEKLEGMKSSGTDLGNSGLWENRLEELKRMNSMEVPATMNVSDLETLVGQANDDLRAIENTEENQELIAEMQKNITRLNAFIANHSDEKTDAADTKGDDNVLLDAVIAAEAELALAKTDQAHHMTIKSLEKKLADAKAAAGL